MKYKLELTQDQADVISAACELLSRLKLGQFNRIVDHTLEERFAEGMSVDEFCERRDEMEKHLLAARQACFDDLQNTFAHSHGIGRNQNAQIAWNVHQVLRYYAGHDERPPYAVWGELPKIEKVLEREDYPQYEDKWIAYHREGMIPILHGKCIKQHQNMLIVKKKKGRRTDFIDICRVVKVFDSKKECYEFKEVKE